MKRITKIECLILFALAALASRVAISQTVSAGREEQVKQINMLLSQGNSPAAAALILKYLNERPDEKPAAGMLMRLGSSYEMMNRFSDAEQAFKRVYTEWPKDPSAPEAMLAAARDAMRDKRITGAIQIYELALDRYPDSTAASNARFELAPLYEQAGKGADAVRILKDAARKNDPYAQRAKYELAQLYIRLENYYEAEAALNSYIKDNPADDSLKLTLAQIYLKQEKYDQAIKIYNELVKKQPGNQAYEEMSFQAYKDAAQLDELADELEGEKRKNPDDLATVKKLKRLYLWDNDSIGALNQLEIIVAKEPGNFDDAVILARVYYQNQWTKKARETLENLLVKRPDFSPALEQLGEMYYAEKQPEKAREAWEKASRFNPNDAQSYSRLASYYWMRDRYADVTKLYEEGRLKLGQPSLFTRELAQLYFAQMRFKESLKEYIALVIQNPGDAGSRDIIVGLIGRDELKDDGYKMVESAADERPDNIEINLLAAEIAMGRGFTDAAMKRLESLSRASKVNVGFYSEAGRRLLARGEAAKAAALFDTAADRETGDTAGLLLQAARAWQQASETAKAEKDYLRIAEKMPDSPGADEAFFRLAGLAVDRNDISRARALYSKLVAEYPLSPYVGDAFVAEAKAELRLGEFDLARQAFDALASNPRTSRYADEIFFYRAELRLLDLKKEESQKLYSQLIQQYPESRFVADSINRLLFLDDTESADPITVQAYIEAEKKMLSGQVDNAEGMLRGLAVTLSDGPLRAYTRFRLGELLESEKRYEDASVFFKEAADGGGLPELRPSANVRLAAVLVLLGRKSDALSRYQAVITEDPRGFWAQRARAEAQLLQPQSKELP